MNLAVRFFSKCRAFAETTLQLTPPQDLDLTSCKRKRFRNQMESCSQGLSIRVCVNSREGEGTTCADQGSVELVHALKRALSEEHLRIPVRQSKCLQQCAQGPAVVLAPSGEIFSDATPAHLPKIIQRVKELSG